LLEDTLSLKNALKKINKERIIEIAKDLIRIPSVTGEEKEVMQFAYDLLEDIGLEPEFYGSKERPIIQAITNPDKEKLLIFNGHLDVVSIAKIEAWTHDPWNPVLEDNYLFGRGASDMKSSCAVMIHLMELVKNMDLELSVGLHLVPDEEKGAEFGTKIITDMIQNGELRRPNYVVIGEQSNLKVRIAERGIFRFQVKFYGQAAHTATCRVSGINAISKAAKGILALEHHIDKFHELIGYPMQSVNLIEGGKASNQVPAECTITVDRRLIIGESAEDVVAEVRADLIKAGKEDKDWRWEIVAPKDEHGNWVYTPANYTSLDSELGKAFRNAVPAALGKKADLYVDWAGSTDGRFYRGAGIQTIGFGPQGFGAHGPDEFVNVDTLQKLALVYIALIYELS
jgi:acetylornithine deacetylase/succinyl-diaminopimelate desuccinylase family protein